MRWRVGFDILEKARSRHDYPSSILRKRKAVLEFRIAQCEMKAGSYLKAVLRFIFSGLLDPGRAIKVLLGREKK